MFSSEVVELLLNTIMEVRGKNNYKTINFKLYVSQYIDKNISLLRNTSVIYTLFPNFFFHSCTCFNVQSIPNNLFNIHTLKQYYITTE